AAVDAGRTPAAAVQTARVQALLAHDAGVVAPHEGGDDEVTLLDGADGAAGGLDNADELVADLPRAVRALALSAVLPQVGAADAARDDAHDGVGGVDDLRVRQLLDADVAEAVDAGGL